MRAGLLGNLSHGHYEKIISPSGPEFSRQSATVTERETGDQTVTCRPACVGASRRPVPHDPGRGLRLDLGGSNAIITAALRAEIEPDVADLSKVS
jgi:hypothetical protein